MFSNFRFAKYTFNLIAQEDMLLPTFKSSMFRGGFGRIFKSLACVNTISKNCKICPIKEKCSYAYIFETATTTEIPRPYIIESSFISKRFYRKDEQLTFTVVLLGKSITYLPYFIFTFIELGNKIGLTSKKRKFRLEKVVDSSNNIVFKDKEFLTEGVVLSWNDILNLENQYNSDKLILNFVTPLRLMYKNKLVSKIDFELLMKRLVSRINSICKYHCDISSDIDYKFLVEQSKNIKVDFDFLSWKDWVRHSNRQQTNMLLGGLVGNISFKGDFDDFLPFIKLGSYIHIGKSCTFGLGKYEIV